MTEGISRVEKIRCPVLNFHKSCSGSGLEVFVGFDGTNHPNQVMCPNYLDGKKKCSLIKVKDPSKYGPCIYSQWQSL